MNAKEMFEELGFTLAIHKNKGMKYTKIENKVLSKHKTIVFKNDTRECTAWETQDVNGYMVNLARFINSKEHKAVIKQLEELGWL